MQKIIAFFLLISFTLLNTSYRLYAEPLPGSVLPSHGQITVNPESLIDSLSLPEEFGSISEVFQGDGRLKVNLGCCMTCFHYNWHNCDINLIEFFANSFKMM